VSATGRLVGGDAAGNVTEFDPETLQPISSLPAARTAPSSLQFDDAGKLLLVTSADQQVQLYDVASRSRIGDPISSGSPNGWVEGWLRPDGRAIAINYLGGVAEWTIDFDRAAEAACVFAGRNLTRAEWATYLGAGQPYRRTCPDFPAQP
jgi:WD40 repeat protein